MSNFVDHAQLSGLADPLGMRTGFLIPVFTTRRVNAQLIEQISADGKVSGFEPLHPQDTSVLPVGGGMSSIGKLCHWGFGLGKDLLYGQGDENRDKLEAAMDMPFLEQRPMLCMEVAEFLGLKQRRIQLAERIFRDMSSKRDVAVAWRDASILTPDLRDVLAKDGSNQGLDFTRLVARVEGSTVLLAGLDKRAQNSKLIRRGIQQTMRSLTGLYANSFERWDIKFVNIAKRQPEDLASELDIPRGLIYVADEQIRAFPSRDDKLVDGMRIFQPGQHESFRLEASRSRVPSFILYTLRSHLPRIERFSSDSGNMWPLGVALRDSSHPVPRTAEIYALDRYEGTNIIVAKPPGIFGAAGFTGELRDALNYMADAHRSNLHQLPFEAGVFLRARGNQPNRDADAWLQIYERCIRQGIVNPTGLKFESDVSAESDPLQTEALFFPGLISLMTDKTKFPRRRVIDAAAVVKFDNSNVATGLQHEERCIAFMKRLGLDFERGRGQIGWSDRQGEVNTFEISLGYGRGRTRYQLDDAWRAQPEEIRRFVIVDEADPRAVLEAIAKRRELLLTLRDIAILSGRSPNVWLLFGSQMRRFASGVASKSRTYYFALLIEAARRHGHLPRDWASFIEECLYGGRLGSSLHIIISQTIFEHGICSVAFRFVDRLAEPEKTDRLRLFLDKDGPRIAETR